MADLVQGITIRVKTDGTGAITEVTSELQKAKTAAEGVGAGADTAKTGFLGMSGGALELAQSLGLAIGGVELAKKAIEGFIELLKTAVETSGEFQTAQVQLDNTFRLLGSSMKAATGDTAELIKSLRDTSSFSNSELMTGLDKLSILSRSATGAMALLPGIVEIASARNLDFAETAEKVGRSIETGMVRQLIALGANFTEADKAAFKAGDTIDRTAMLAAKTDFFGGSSLEHLQTYQGSMQNLKSTFSELFEAFIPILNSVVIPTIQEIARVVKAFSTEVERLLAGKITLRFSLDPLGSDIGSGGGYTDDPNDPAVVAAKAAAKKFSVPQHYGPTVSPEQRAAIDEGIKKGQEAIRKAIEERTVAEEALQTILTKSVLTEQGYTSEEQTLMKAIQTLKDNMVGLGTAYERQELTQAKSLLTTLQETDAREMLRKVNEAFDKTLETTTKHENEDIAAEQKRVDTVAKIIDGNIKWEDSITKVNRQMDELTNPIPLTALQQETQRLNDTVQDQINKYTEDIARQIEFQNATKDPEAIAALQARIVLDEEENQKLKDRTPLLQAIAANKIAYAAIGQEFSDALSAGIQQGSGLKEAFTALFGDISKDFTKSLTKSILEVFGGKAPIDPGPGPQQAQYQTDLAKYKASDAGMIQTAIIGLAGIANSYMSRATEAQVAMQNVALAMTVALSTAASLATVPVYGWIAAAVVLIAAEVAHFLAPSPGSAYEGGVLQITGGAATMRNYQNLSTAEITSDQQQAMAIYNGYVDTWIGILAKMPVDLIAAIEGLKTQMFTSLNINHSGGDPLGTTGGPSGGWAKEITDWLNNGLPGEIDRYFWGPFAEGLKNLGLSPDRLYQIHAQMDAMKPQDALKYANDLVDALLAINKVFDTMAVIAANIKNLGTFNVNAQGQQQGASQSLFDFQLMANYQNLLQESVLVATETGDAQAQAAAALAQGLQAAVNALAQFVNHIGQLVNQIADSIAAAKFSIAMDQVKGDKSAQQKLLYDQLVFTEDQIKNASKLNLSPDQIAADEKKAQDLIMQLYGLNPNAATAAWAQQALTNLQHYADDALATLAKAAQDEVTKLIADFQPFLDFFGTATHTAGQAALDLAAALALLAAAIAGLPKIPPPAGPPNTDPTDPGNNKIKPMNTYQPVTTQNTNNFTAVIQANTNAIANLAHAVTTRAVQPPPAQQIQLSLDPGLIVSTVNRINRNTSVNRNDTGVGS